MNDRIYLIQPGDTLYNIAKRFSTDVKTLADLNGKPDPDKIRFSDILRLPPDTMYYTVQSGDSLCKIARFIGSTVEEIARLNDIPDVEMIYAGQVLKLPDENFDISRLYTVQPDDTLWKIANKFDIPVAELINLNRLRRPDSLYPGQTLRIN